MNKEKIFIASTNPSDIRSWRATLEKENFQVFIVANKDDLLNEVKSVSPGLIIIDAFVSDLEVIESVRLLKSDPITKDIVEFTILADDSEEYVYKSMANGSDVTLCKPLGDLSKEVKFIKRIFEAVKSQDEE